MALDAGATIHYGTRKESNGGVLSKLWRPDLRIQAQLHLEKFSILTMKILSSQQRHKIRAYSYLIIIDELD